MKASNNDFSIHVATVNGSGSQTANTTLMRAVFQMGVPVSGKNLFPSNIAGLPTWFTIRVSERGYLARTRRNDVLVAMNPETSVEDIASMGPGSILLLNEGVPAPKIPDDRVVYKVPFNKLVEPLVADAKLRKLVVNMIYVGVVSHLLGIDFEEVDHALTAQLGRKPKALDMNRAAVKLGAEYATEHLKPAPFRVERRNKTADKVLIEGNQAGALGALFGGVTFLSWYPITPSSSLAESLQGYLERYRRDPKTGEATFAVVQAEDEIAAISAAIGASFAGALGVTGSSGPGIALKTEAMGLALMTELPLVIINVQRGGPSTGLPTKTEQSDLFQAVYGRNGECPIPVLAARSPADCFETAYEACRIAIDCRTPVILLSDGSLANGSEPWLLPDVNSLPKIDPDFATDPAGFMPYKRDEKLARPWAIPGTPGLEHRIGGLEKDALTGNISYDAQNHEKMVRTRAEKVRRIADRLEPTEPFFDPAGDVLVIGWGGTYGSITQAVIEARQTGLRVGHVHLRHVFPLPNDLTDIAARYRNVLVPELNMGQLRFHLRGQLGLESVGLNKIQGKPFHVAEVRSAIESLARRKHLPAEQEIA